MNKITPFHLAFTVYNLNKTKEFYKNVLGCRVGRSAERWIDFDFYGHQITAHLSTNDNKLRDINEVDSKKVPVSHFGLILLWKDWHSLSKDLLDKKVKFIIKPYIRFKGEIGEQATMFIGDPSENVIEFKSFKNKKMIFAN